MKLLLFHPYFFKTFCAQKSYTVLNFILAKYFSVFVFSGEKDIFTIWPEDCS